MKVTRTFLLKIEIDETDVQNMEHMQNVLLDKLNPNISDIDKNKIVNFLDELLQCIPCE